MSQVQAVARQIIYPRDAHHAVKNHMEADHCHEHCTDAACDDDADHDCRPECAHHERAQAAKAEMILPAVRIDAVGSSDIIAVNVVSHIESHESCCGGTTAPLQSVIDVPLIEQPTGITLTMIAFAVFVDAVSLSVPHHYVGYKIGPSPPFLASTTQHTYLHTSVFLI